MTLPERLLDAGFAQVILLDAAECDVPACSTVVLALWTYDAEAEPAPHGVWIHPYYFASQKAYMAASSIAKELTADGVTLRDDILLKPIFARLPGFTQGRNTLSSICGVGSRFHVQTLTMQEALPPTYHLEDSPHPLRCGDCHRCEATCPTNALEGGIFHRERCLRNWQMSGQLVPEHIRQSMGNRLIGCDECQRACPHNPAAEGSATEAIALKALLVSPKESAAKLRELIGANLAIPNRVLSQACLMAGCSGQKEFIPLLEPLVSHPSPTVAVHAQWALKQLQA